VTVVPVVLERALLAGMLGLPALALLAFTALEGELGRWVSVIVVGAALIYVAVTWLLGMRGTLRAQAAAATPAAADATVEPFGRTALRAGVKAVVVIVLAGLLAVLFPLGATVVVTGFAILTALGAHALHRFERRAGHRLVRVAGEPGLRRF
jgi:hypothetical protein